MADIVISPKTPKRSLPEKIEKLLRKIFGAKQSQEANHAPNKSVAKEHPRTVTHETEMERRLKILIRALSSDETRTVPMEETSAALIERIETAYPTLNQDKQAAVRFTFFEILKRVNLNTREWVQCICFLGKRNKQLSCEEMEDLISELKSMRKRKGERKNIKDLVKRVKKARETKRKKREKEKAGKKRP